MDEDRDEAAQAFEELRAEVTLMRRAIERLAAERREVPEPIDYTETLGRMQQGVDATADRIAVINDVIARSPALAITPEQMAQRIAAAGNAARREDQAALAKAGEDKARVMADLRAIAGSAWSRHHQKNRQLWFGLGGAAIGILVWAILPGLVVREIAPASWQWPERMAARTLNMPMWEGGQRMMQAAAPEGFANIAAGDRLVTANREALEACRKRANRAHEVVRCTVNVEAE